MSMLRPQPAQQNDVAEWLRSLAAQVGKYFAGGRNVLKQDGFVGQWTRSGQATIGTGTTSVTVTHGLVYLGVATAPTLQQIHITLGNSPTNAIGVPWVDTITATQFNINCANPGASGATFGWMVIPI